MKQLLITILIVLFSLVAYNYYTDNNDTVTKDEFNAAHAELRQRIDSVMRNCDSLKTELRAVRANTDTLKAGQEVIFRTMQENKNKDISLWNLIGL
ncbi:MAG: hypothetical protein II939_14650 [Bacteroidales bacterium]|nr:hypothetical protein [Bacteroidales bacterium]